MERQQIFVIGGILGSLILVIAFALVIDQMKFGGDPSNLLTHGRPIHWHADLTAVVCGEEQRTPVAEKDGQIGTGPIHNHDDGRIHMEGTFNKESDVALRKYLLAVGIPFTENGIYTKTDGSPCPNNNQATGSAVTTGRLHGTVNGKEMPNILDYSMRDGDKIRLIYE